MQRYFLEEDYIEGNPLTLIEENYHHAARVMRMKPKDKCYLSFMNDQTIVAEVIEIDGNTITLSEVSKEVMDKELPVSVTIACGYTKGDKLELVAQKATELGMDRLVGFPAQASVVKWDHKKLNKKQERLSKIAKEAAEQSHRQSVPDIELFSSYQELLESLKYYTHVLIAYEESAKSGEASQFAKVVSRLDTKDRVLIIFGPEGGLSLKEVQEIEGMNGVRCALGPRILRAETAPMYALSAISYELELRRQL